MRRRTAPGLAATLLLALLVFTAALPALFVAVPARAGGEFPEPSGFVNDYAGILAAGERERIEEVCRSLKAATGAEMAVVTVASTGDQTIQMYAVRMFQAWGVGEKGRDNGVLILVAVEDRQVWVEVGYGLEGILPDGKVGAILDRHLVPAFREGRYGDGLYACARALAEEIRTASGPGGGQPGSGGWPGSVPTLYWTLLLGVAALAVVGGVYLVARAAIPRCPSCRSRLLVRERVVTPATHVAGGVALVLYSCPRCGYQREKRRHLPRLVRVDGGGWARPGPSGRGGPFWGPFGGGGWPGRSGGFGGFGGGRSGGGGAGRSW